MRQTWVFGDLNAGKPWQAGACRDAWGGTVLQTKWPRADRSKWWVRTANDLRWFRWPWQAWKHYRAVNGYPHKRAQA